AVLPYQLRPNPQRLLLDRLRSSAPHVVQCAVCQPFTVACGLMSDHRRVLRVRFHLPRPDAPGGLWVDRFRGQFTIRNSAEKTEVRAPHLTRRKNERTSSTRTSGYSTAAKRPPPGRL